MIDSWTCSSRIGQLGLVWADQNDPALRRWSSDNAAPHGDIARNRASILTRASPPLNANGLRRSNDRIKMKTRTAASLLCQPTNRAKAANTNTTIPISMAPLVFQTANRPHVCGVDGWVGVTPLASMSP